MKRKEILTNLTINKCILNSIIKHHFITSFFFLVAADAFCQSFCRFFGSATANIFPSVNRNNANVLLGKYFSADVLNC